MGLNTNGLVRYIMRDDSQQSAMSVMATALIESLDSDNVGYITMVSVVELYWVLTSSYALTEAQVAQALELILRTRQFLVERADQVMRALRVFGEGRADFADCLIERSANGAGCSMTMTFDVKAAKHAGMTLLA